MLNPFVICAWAQLELAWELAVELNPLLKVWLPAKAD